MQDIDGLAETHRVDGPVRVAVETFNQLHDSAAKSFQWLRRWWMLPGLCQVQLESEPFLDATGKATIVALAGSYP